MKRAGVNVQTVKSKPQAADEALKKRVRQSLARGVDWMVLVSDDSDFVETIQMAREAELRTVVVGDRQRALGQRADIWLPWAQVERGEITDKMLKSKMQGGGFDREEDEEDEEEDDEDASFMSSWIEFGEDEESDDIDDVFEVITGLSSQGRKKGRGKGKGKGKGRRKGRSDFSDEDEGFEEFSVEMDFDEGGLGIIGSLLMGDELFWDSD